MKKLSSRLLKIFILAILVMAGLKLLSNEDDWICRDGEWVKHGNPAAPMPEEECL